MENTATPAANDPQHPETISDDDKVYELKFTQGDLIHITCALQNELTRAYDPDSANLTDLGIRASLALLRRINILVFGRPNPPEPWTQHQRQHWRLALIAERRALHIAARMPSIDEAPL